MNVIIWSTNNTIHTQAPCTLSVYPSLCPFIHLYICFIFFTSWDVFSPTPLSLHFMKNEILKGNYTVIYHVIIIHSYIINTIYLISLKYSILIDIVTLLSSYTNKTTMMPLLFIINVLLDDLHENKL